MRVSVWTTRIALAGLLVTSCTDAANPITTASPVPTAPSLPATTTSLPAPASTPATIAVPATAAPTTTTIPLVPSGVEASFTEEGVFVRGCNSQVYGNDVAGEPLDQLGALSLFGLGGARDLDEDFLAPAEDGELSILKFVTQLEGDTPVWLAVGTEDREHVSLIYDSSRWGGNSDNRLPMAAGDPVVRFAACDNASGFSQYNGGMLVNGARCVSLEVYVAEADTTPLIFEIPFGPVTCD